MSVVRNNAIAGALLVMLFIPGCGPFCEARREKSYSGSDVLPDSRLTAEEMLNKAHIRFAEDRSWIPHPSEYTDYLASIPPLPYAGSTHLEIEVTPLRDVFVQDYSYAADYGCEPNSPEAPARVTIRTSDGVLDEEVEITLYGQGGPGFGLGTITEPKGRIKEYFAGYEYPSVPRLLVEIQPTYFRLQFMLERPMDRGGTYSYVTLL